MTHKFKDTEGNELTVGTMYADHAGDICKVIYVESIHLHLIYENKTLGDSGHVHLVPEDINNWDFNFTKVNQEISASTGTKNDSGKLRFDLVPSDALQEVVEVITYGESKYPSVELDGTKVQNWRVLPDAENRLFAAAQRHLWQHRSGETLDQETKLKHLAHAASSLLFLIAIENEKIGKANERKP